MTSPETVKALALLSRLQERHDLQPWESVCSSCGEICNLWERVCRECGGSTSAQQIPCPDCGGEGACGGEMVGGLLVDREICDRCLGNRVIDAPGLRERELLALARELGRQQAADHQEALRVA